MAFLKIATLFFCYCVTGKGSKLFVKVVFVRNILLLMARSFRDFNEDINCN